MEDVIKSEADHRPGAPHSGQNGGGGKLHVSPDALRALPSDFVKRHRVLPLRIQDGAIHIATVEQGNQRVIDDIRLLTGLEVVEQVFPSSEVLEKIAEHYQVTVEQMIENLNPARVATAESKNLHDIEVMANEPTVINLVNLIISTALRERASDIHLVAFEETLQLRYRIDGLLHEKPPPPKQLHAALVSRVKIMADMPSGHAMRGIVLATILADIFPDKKDQLLARGREIGSDRALAGIRLIPAT